MADLTPKKKQAWMLLSIGVLLIAAFYGISALGAFDGQAAQYYGVLAGFIVILAGLYLIISSVITLLRN